MERGQDLSHGDNNIMSGVTSFLNAMNAKDFDMKVYHLEKSANARSELH